VDRHPTVTSRQVLVDASNLRTGGAVQVAASFVDELADMVDDPDAGQRWPFLGSLHVDVSTVVARNLHPTTAGRLDLAVVDRHWRDRSTWRRSHDLWDASFVVFGPEYGRSRAGSRIVGCADGLTLLPWPDGVPRLGPTRRIKLWAKRRLWRRSMRRSHIVVESEALGRQLREFGAAADHVHVVPNSYHHVFDTPSAWQPLPQLPKAGSSIRLAYVARAHPHKNHAFLGRVHEELLERHGLDVRFMVTLTKAEMAQMPATFVRAAVNVGSLPIAAVPTLYALCDGSIFPSLLETFSVTPLEVLRMGTPLLAADRPFVRDVCLDAATYFDPLDEVSTADVIAAWWSDPTLRQRQVAAGRRRVADLPTARSRAEAFLDVIAGALGPQRQSDHPT
jgi:glycosyltransferase involved in cell wall biosynthesis